MRKTISAVFFLGFVTAAMSPGLAHATRIYGALKFEPCALRAPNSPYEVEAQCTSVEVPENHAAPNGAKIKLALAWVPTEAASPKPDPVFMLAGGPGQSARDTFPSVETAFKPLMKNRDVFLLDQRGTGGSNPMVCRNDEGISAVAEANAESVEELKQFAADCLKDIKGDTRFYATSDAVKDLEFVRKKLNVAEINLIGVSYGTRVGQEFLRRYPNSTRSVILDGVAPAEMILGSDHARNLEDALDLHFTRCTRDPVCAKKFGSPRGNLRHLVEQLKSSPQKITYRDPNSGEQKQGEFNLVSLAAVVRLMSYAPETAAILPLLLNEAIAGRPQVIVEQSAMLQESVGEMIAHGMQLSVICAEDAAFLKINPDDETRLLGNSLIELTKAQCSVWPHTPAPKDFHTPVQSNKPVLLLSGEFDPVTPPRYGEQVLKHLSNARHIVAKGQGHNVFGKGCMPKLMVKFMDDKDPKALDATCMDRLGYVPPFAGFYGWDP